jgi:hypothetical protein
VTVLHIFHAHYVLCHILQAKSHIQFKYSSYSVAYISCALCFMAYITCQIQHKNSIFTVRVWHIFHAYYVIMLITDYGIYYMINLTYKSNIHRMMCIYFIHIMFYSIYYRINPTYKFNILHMHSQ